MRIALAFHAVSAFVAFLVSRGSFVYIFFHSFSTFRSLARIAYGLWFCIAPRTSRTLRSRTRCCLDRCVLSVYRLVCALARFQDHMVCALDHLDHGSGSLFRFCTHLVCAHCTFCAFCRTPLSHWILHLLLTHVSCAHARTSHADHAVCTRLALLVLDRTRASRFATLVLIFYVTSAVASLPRSHSRRSHASDGSFYSSHSFCASVFASFAHSWFACAHRNSLFRLPLSFGSLVKTLSGLSFTRGCALWSCAVCIFVLHLRFTVCVRVYRLLDFLVVWSAHGPHLDLWSRFLVLCTVSTFTSFSRISLFHTRSFSVVDRTWILPLCGSLLFRRSSFLDLSGLRSSLFAFWITLLRFTSLDLSLRHAPRSFSARLSSLSFLPASFWITSFALVYWISFTLDLAVCAHLALDPAHASVASRTLVWDRSFLLDRLWITGSLTSPLVFWFAGCIVFWVCAHNSFLSGCGSMVCGSYTLTLSRSHRTRA